MIALTNYFIIFYFLFFTSKSNGFFCNVMTRMSALLQAYVVLAAWLGDYVFPYTLSLLNPSYPKSIQTRIVWDYHLHMGLRRSLEF